MQIMNDLKQGIEPSNIFNVYVPNGKKNNVKFLIKDVEPSKLKVKNAKGPH